jgi:hypothetical protein
VLSSVSPPRAGPLENLTAGNCHHGQKRGSMRSTEPPCSLKTTHTSIKTPNTRNEIFREHGGMQELFRVRFSRSGRVVFWHWRCSIAPRQEGVNEEDGTTKTKELTQPLQGENVVFRSSSALVERNDKEGITLADNSTPPPAQFRCYRAGHSNVRKTRTATDGQAWSLISLSAARRAPVRTALRRTNVRRCKPSCGRLMPGMSPCPD